MNVRFYNFLDNEKLVSLTPYQAALFSERKVDSGSSERLSFRPEVMEL